MVAICDLDFVQVVMLFFAVTRNERDCTAFIHQTDNCTDLLNTNAKLISDSFHNFDFVYNESVD
jgi:hypothetical protein